MAEPVLQIAGLRKSFGALAATDGVDLDLRDGEILALIGPNGAGKSTLIAQIAGSLAPDAGRVMLAGRDMAGMSVAARARAGLGRTFQVSSLAMPLSARANVRIAVQARAPRRFGVVRPVARDAALNAPAEAALGRVGLDPARWALPVAELSHGERRRVELAAALAARPRLLLLDEPMAGLGADGTAAMADLLEELRAELPILLVEHDMSAVFRLADRIAVLVAGRIIATGAPDAIRADAAVQEAYLGVDA